VGLAAVAAAIVLSACAGVATRRRLGPPAEHDAARLLKAMLFGAMPFVTFFNVAHVEFDRDVLGGVVVGWIALATVAALAWRLTRHITTRPRTGTVMLGSILANTGYLGYPLVTVLLGASSLPTAVVYDLLVAGPALFIGAFATGAAFGDAHGDSLLERLRAFFFLNPLMPAFVAGLLAPSALAPDVLVDASRILVFCMLPAGFFAVGVYLDSILAPRRALPALSREVTVAVVLRLAVAPLLLWVLALPLIDLPGPYLLLAAMPCGINTLLVAGVYELDRRRAAAMIAWSTTLVLTVVVMLSAVLA
jgi:predicted permease